MHFLSLMLGAAMLLSASFQGSSHYEWNKKSTLTTDQQVEFPGIVLESGTYVIRLCESGEKRSVVQVMNKDETQVLASVVAVPDHRTRPEDNSEFTFHRATSGGSHAVRSWFFAGDLVGLEFVYPKHRAEDIAKESDDHVLASNSTNKGDVIVAITPNGKEIIIDGHEQHKRRKPQ